MKNIKIIIIIVLVIMVFLFTNKEEVNTSLEKQIEQDAQEKLEESNEMARQYDFCSQYNDDIEFADCIVNYEE